MRDSLTSWRNRSPGDLSIELDEVRSTPVDPAVEAARRAFRAWSRTTLEKRVDLLRAARGRIDAAKDELARGIAIETGKPLREAVGEMGAVVAKFDLTIADAERYLADEPESRGPHPATVRRRARGPAAVIGPFNFPIHLAHGAILAHLVAGNTVIFKPSPLAAVVAGRYAALMSDVLPPGVFNLVQGGAAEGRAVAVHPAVRSVVFTGSVPVGRALAQELAGDIGKDVALELGGKNAAIVLDDADLQAAADAVAEGACLTAGQRCNATSRVIVDRRVAGEFVPLLLRSIERFAPNDPLDPNTTLGPLISDAAVKRYERLTREPGEWLKPGAVTPEVGGKRGHYVRPAVVRWRDRSQAMASALAREEAFAPIIEVFDSDSPEDAVALHNTTPYGLTASVFTRRRETFERVAAELEVGNVYANLPTTFSPSTLPFGGLRDSGNRHPGGRGFVRFTTDEQVVQAAKGGFVEG
jgi:acyl-CoA reductase-like NAD-dependent aldehyde dehydrogenase